MKKLTTEEFIRRAIEVHGDKYDYSKVNYKNKEEKVCIICPKHGEFWQRAGDHMSGRGCCRCGHERTNASKVLSNEEFILRASTRHNNKYCYDKTNYIGFDKDVIVTCPIHGDFLVNAHQHISNLTGCPKCAKLAQGPARSNTQEFVEKAITVHGPVYDYSKVAYVLATQKVEIICPKHGSFWMTPNKHLLGECCPKCNESKGEQLVSKILSESNYIFDTQYTISVTSEIRNNIRIDFAIKSNNIIYLIEYHGIQHYEPIDYFGGFSKFVEQQARDNLLRKLVLENKSYRLLEIDYRWNKNTIRSQILKFLKDVPISSDTNSKSGELLETLETDNQQPSLSLTTKEGSETNTWNLDEEYNSDTSTRHLEIDDDIVRTIQ